MKRKPSPLLRALIGLIGVLLLAVQGVSAQDTPTFHIGVLDDELGRSATARGWPFAPSTTAAVWSVPTGQLSSLTS